ncbi:MAG TPA: universal stress protein [Acidobacteriota bacterium]|nr:universal stress protein [Acidobacteriota bacterium]
MHRFRKILCPVDFSEYSALALRYASALARESQAQLLVYHLIPDLTQAISYLEGNYLGTVNEALAASAGTRTEEFVKNIVPEDQPVSRRIGSGNPSEGILRTAREESADLIVMGTHGHTGYERFFIGSVTNRILHKSTIPVLTICKPSHHFIQDDKDRPVKIERILCALDFDSNNKRIAELALSIAREYHSKIRFLHVVPTKEAEDWEAVERNANRSFRELVETEKEESCEIQFVVLPGEPGNAILRTIEEENIDLLVMGHHTRKPIEELFLGSVAKRMVTDASCPVLVARSTADDIYHDVTLL